MPQTIDYAALAQQARSGTAPSGDGGVDYGALAEHARTLYDPNRRPASAEDFAPAQRDISPANILLNAAKSIPAGLLSTAKTLYNDQRPEDARLGPAAVLAPLVRAAGAGALSETRKVPGAKSGFEAAGHAAAAVLPLVGPAAAQAGEDIGSGDVARFERGSGNALALVGGMVAPGAVARVAPKVAPALATVGEQLAAKGRAVSGAVSKVNPLVLDIAGEVAGHVIGAPLGVPTLARRVLAHVLETGRTKAPAVSNTGGRLVKAGSAPSTEAEIASALEQLRAPEAPQSVELPPPAELPPGYVPRSEAPPVTVPANAGGRLVPPQTPTTTQALADALAEARVPEPPVRVTTPPEASLPPGYTPRSTVPKPAATPKPRAAKADLPEPVKKAIAAGERKRAYFLKPVEEMVDAAATAADPAVAPSRVIRKEDLPASWRSHTGQDIFPLTGDEGKAVVAGLRDELKARGLSIGQARMEISKNRSLPTEIRAQLLRALEQSGKAAAK